MKPKAKGTRRAAAPPADVETKPGGDTARLAAIVASSDDAIIGKKLDGTIVSWNAAAERMYGYAAAEVVGQPVSILAPTDRQDEIQDILARLRKGERVERLETQRRCKDGRIIRVSLTISPVRGKGGRIDGASTIARDITQRHAQEEEIRRLNRLYRALSQANQAIIRATDRSTLLESVCRELAEHAQFRLVWVGEVVGPEPRVKSVAQAGPDGGFLEGLVVFGDDRPEAQGPTGTAVREGRGVVYNDLASDPRVEPWRARVRQYEFGSAAAFPIRVRESLWGSLTVCVREPGFFGGEERALLEEVAGDLGFALGNLENEARRRELEAYNRQLATIVEASADAIVSRTLEGIVTSWNGGAERIYGYTAAEMIGRPIGVLLPPGREAELDEIGARLRRGEATHFFETTRRHKEGREVAVTITVSPLRDRTGNVVGAATIARDITDRKRAEEQLAVLKQSIDSHFDGAYWFDSENRLVYVNDAGCRAVGYSREELLGQPLARLNRLASAEGLAGVWHRLRTERTFTTETVHRRKDGTEFPVEVVATYVRIGGHEFNCGFARDITDRKRAEAELRLQAAALNAAANAILITDAAGRIEWVNEAFTALSGYSAAETVGRNPRDLIKSGRHDAAFYRQMWETIAAGRVWHGEVVNRRKDGGECVEEMTITPVRGEHGAISHYIAIKQDVSARKRDEARLAEQAALLDRASDAIYVTDLHCVVLYWNAAAGRIYGWSPAEAVGRKTTEMNSLGENLVSEALATTMARGEWSGERRQVTRAGRPVDVLSRLTLLRDDQGRPQSILVINTDITERKALEARFLRAQRLESIGALASGIAHDLNNVLAPILMGMPLLRDAVRDDSARALLSMVETSAQRGADIVRQVLTFARGSEGQRVALQPKHLIDDMLKMAGETFPKNIEVVQRSEPDLWSVIGDATQLHQALLNLCVNARDAMPAGGRLTLGAENATLDEATAARTPGATAGRYVCLRVTDTGPGIAPDVLERIFEPFFTTKGAGKGTGLGLSTVLGVVKGHGGFVRVESQVGRGTSFELFIPAGTAADAAGGPVKARSAHPWPRAEGELVLLVDDEAAVRAVARQALEEFGYRVLVCGSGIEAVGLFEASRAEIKLVVTDMMMPEMDGPTLVRALRAIDPAVPILGITGVADAATMEGLRVLNLAGMLAKPFTIGKLLQAVREALAPRSAELMP